MLNMKLIFATNNQHKVDEIRHATGQTLELLTLREAGIDIDIPEPHDTIEANASEKSQVIFELTGQDCFSEDTGLEVEALHGEPGVKSARYAGDDRSPDKNIDKLLQKMETIDNRKARFKTIISLLIDGKETIFEGICEGHILTERRGNQGFGYDPVFMPQGADRSFAEMDMTEKDRYSHRAKAVQKLVAFLNSFAQKQEN